MIMDYHVYKQCKRSEQNNHLLLELEKYMIDKSLYNSVGFFERKIKSIKKKEDISEKIIQPKYFDSLFWCFFLIKYGELEYAQVGDHNFKKEKALKISNIENMKKNSSLLKNYKLSKSKIESDLLNSKVIDIYSFYALCLYNDLNVILIKNNCYYEFLSNDNNNISVVYLNKRASCELNIDKNKLDEIKRKYFRIENVNKPIKAISAYKLDELITFTKYFNIKLTYDSGKNKVKKDLYDEIKAFMLKN